MNAMQQLPGAAPQAPQIANAPTQLPMQQQGMVPGQAAASGIAQLLSTQNSSLGSTSPASGISPSLTELPKEVLQAAILGEGGTGIQPIAALAELSKRIKSEKMMAAQQGQQAIQAAQQGPQGPIKEQILEEAGIGAVSRPPMRMAQGGIVAFADGGSTPYTGRGEFGGMDAEQSAMDELRREELLEKRRRADIAARYPFVKKVSPEGARKMLLENPWLETPQTGQTRSGVPPRPASAPVGNLKSEADALRAASLSPEEQARSDAYERSPGNMRELEMAIAQERDPAKREILVQEARKLMGGAPAPAQAVVQRPQMPPSGPSGIGGGVPMGMAPSAPQSGIGGLPAARPQAPPSQSDMSGVNAAADAQKALLEKRRTLPEDVLNGRGSIDQLMSSMIAQEREEAAKVEREATAERARIEAENSKPLLSDPRMLMAMAGGMSTKRGEIFGSLARGTGKELGRRADTIEAARLEHKNAQKEVRGMNQANRNRQMLEIQRQQAIREGDLNRVNDIDDKIAALDMSKATTGVAAKQGDYKVGQEDRKIAADEERARAAMVAAQAQRDQAGAAKDVNADNRAIAQRNMVLQRAAQDKEYQDIGTKLANAHTALGASPANKQANSPLVREIQALEARKTRALIRIAGELGVQLQGESNNAAPAAPPVNKSLWGQPQVVKQ